MTGFSEAVDRQMFDNLMSIALGLSFAVAGLQDFILDSMTIEHQNILQNIPGGKCTKNCSRKYGRAFNRWCNICRSWKEQLRMLCRYKNQWKRITWKKVDIVDFVHQTVYSYESMAAVFVRDPHSVRQRIFQDLSAIMSLLTNMKSFTIDTRIISDVQRIRNQHYAHNYKAMIHHVEKEQYLNSLINLLKVPEILRKPSAKSALALLEELKSSDEIPIHMLEHPTSQQALVLIRNSFEETSNRSQDKALISINSNYIERIEELIQNAPGGKFARKRKDKPSFISRIKPFLKYTSIVMVLIILRVYLLMPPTQKTSEGRWSLFLNRMLPCSMYIIFHGFRIIIRCGSRFLGRGRNGCRRHECC